VRTEGTTGSHNKVTEFLRAEFMTTFSKIPFQTYNLQVQPLLFQCY